MRDPDDGSRAEFYADSSDRGDGYTINQTRELCRQILGKNRDA